MPRDFRYRARPRSLAPMRMPVRRSGLLNSTLAPRRRLRVNPMVLLIGGAVVVVALLVMLVVALASGGRNRAANAQVSASPAITALAPSPKANATLDPAATLPPRAAALETPSVTAPTASFRDLSFGARDITMEVRQINQPSFYGGEMFFSAGNGKLDSGAVLKSLYTYNVETDELKKIADAKIAYGEFYETLINKDWLVWLETDHHDKNNIYTMKRSDGKITLLKSCKNGKPKLRLSGNTLIWMEQVDKGKDELMMIDLESQENISLYSFTDIATYGVSAPCIQGDTIVWSSPDPVSSSTSLICTLKLDENSVDTNGQLNVQKYAPGTYVHEPVYNGRYYAWIDGNKSPNAKLYLSEFGQAPKVIAEGVTTYSLGSDILVYGHARQVWVYVLATGETCRLTSQGDLGMLPEAFGRTVVWYDITEGTGSDVLRYKILSDEDVGVTSTPTPEPTATPAAPAEGEGEGEGEPTASAEASADASASASANASPTASASATAEEDE